MSDDCEQRRKQFIQRLYRWHRAIEADGPGAAEARRNLALLRRGLANPRDEAKAYGIVLPMDPPRDEQQVWMLVAGLFALHRCRESHRGQSLGNAMGQLSIERGCAVQRRLEQLLSADRQALPHYLRQAVALLRSDQIPLDYDRLLSDLLVLLRRDFADDAAHQVRLSWARDFFRPRPDDRSQARSEPAST